jgi:hypothetical protein
VEELGKPLCLKPLKGTFFFLFLSKKNLLLNHGLLRLHFIVSIKVCEFNGIYKININPSFIIFKLCKIIRCFNFRS